MIDMFETTFSVIEDDEQRSELSVFYSEYKDRLYYIALSKLHDRADAEDAVQEAFSEIADKPEKFFDIPSEKRLAYVDVIVKNIAINIFNARNKIPSEPFDDVLLSDDIRLDDELFGKVSRDEILSFVDSLPELQRNVLFLHCILGLSIDETAQRLNISLTAANKRLTLARRSVREFLDERGNYHV